MDCVTAKAHEAFNDASNNDLKVLRKLVSNEDFYQNFKFLNFDRHNETPGKLFSFKKLNYFTFHYLQLLFFVRL